MRELMRESVRESMRRRMFPGKSVRISEAIGTLYGDWLIDRGPSKEIGLVEDLVNY